MAKVLATFETLDEANRFHKKLVREHAFAVGITDWKFVCETIRDKRDIYRVYPEYEFDDCGGIIDFIGYVLWEIDRGG